MSIIPFAKARVGTKWFASLDLTKPRNRFHSDKICDISYANIQGKECLIEKFRNSCVMDEDPSYRPKIFHSSGSLIGQEQEFSHP
jgi:RNA recognition motif 2